MIYTTLNAIRVHRPCASGWEKLLAHLGKTKADDEPLLLETVLDSNGLHDALWCLRALGPEHHGWIRHYACDCVDAVAHLLTDERSREAIRVARRFADGQANKAELAAAWEAARAAAAAAARSAAEAWEAAWSAAEAAARSAAEAAAAAVTWSAAEAAARAAQADRLRQYLQAGGRPE